MGEVGPSPTACVRQGALGRTGNYAEHTLHETCSSWPTSSTMHALALHIAARANTVDIDGGVYYLLQFLKLLIAVSFYTC